MPAWTCRSACGKSRAPCPWDSRNNRWTCSVRRWSSIHPAVRRLLSSSPVQSCAIWPRPHTVLQPVPPLIPVVTDLPLAETGNIGDFFEGEAREVVQVHDLQRFRVSLPEFLHQQADFDDLFGALRIGRLHDGFI